MQYHFGKTRFRQFRTWGFKALEFFWFLVLISPSCGQNKGKEPSSIHVVSTGLSVDLDRLVAKWACNFPTFTMY